MLARKACGQIGFSRGFPKGPAPETDHMEEDQYQSVATCYGRVSRGKQHWVNLADGLPPWSELTCKSNALLRGFTKCI